MASNMTKKCRILIVSLTIYLFIYLPLFSFYLLFIYLLFIFMCLSVLYIYICLSCILGANGVQERASHSLEMEEHPFDSHHIGEQESNLSPLQDKEVLRHLLSSLSTEILSIISYIVKILDMIKYKLYVIESNWKKFTFVHPVHSYRFHFYLPGIILNKIKFQFK